MPIFGREGESFSQRLFGDPGVGQGIKNVVNNGPGYVVDRVTKGLNTSGGFLGSAVKTPTASANGGGNEQWTDTGENISPTELAGGSAATGRTSSVVNSQGSSGGSNKSSNKSSNNSIDSAAQDQEDAAKKAEKEAIKAAEQSFNTQKGIAEGAKTSATGQYNWIIDTLGSNKKDLLSQVNNNEAQGIANFDVQGKKTTEQYDGAKQEILGTYRDLQTQQEKIMRGAGMGQSSRSMEAQLKLNNLMGKDLGSVSKNEADSLALIGTAVANLQTKSLEAKNSIETETKSKLDKAALDYNDQITAINNNLQLKADQKANAIAQAETKLANDTASISSWASGLKLKAEQTMAANKDTLDNYIVDMTNSEGLLNSDLGTKESATNKLLTDAGYIPLSQNSGDINGKVGQEQRTTKKYSSAEEIQNAIANGELSAGQGEQQMAALSSGSNVGTSMASAEMNPLYPKNKSMNDPMLSAIFG